MTVKTKNQDTKSTTAPAQLNLADELASISSSAPSLQVYVESSFGLVSQRLNTLWALLEQRVDGRTVTRKYAAHEINAEQLAEIASALSVEAQMDAKSRAQFVASEHGEVLVISCPLINESDEATFGAMTWFTKAPDRENAQQIAKVFEQIGKLINAGAKKVRERVATQTRTAKPSSEQQEVKAFLNASKFENVTALCYALVNSYCQKLGCQKTAIGLVDNNQVTINAVSGIDSVVANSPAIVQIQQAQEECLDHGRRAVVQQALSETDLPSDGLLIHKRWHQSNGGASVASIPVSIDGQPVAVFSLERNLSQPFKEGELEQIEKTIQAFGPAIELMKKSSRSLRRHASDCLHENFLARFKSKVFAFAVAAALAFILLGWMPYRPVVPCTIQPAKINHLTAPYDAVIASAPYFAGDQIKSGEPIIMFDTRSLELDRDAILAQINSKMISRNQAMLNREKTKAAIIEAQMESDRVQLRSVERRIAQGSLLAQYDGTIIRGDLRQQIGQSISQGTPLMEIAPADGMRIELEIPEEQAGLIDIGYVGSFSAGARPGDRHNFKITKITPSTTIRGGRNVVLAEAEVEGDSDWMRTGMTGYANVKAGWQPVWWMMSHRIIDGLRLGFWL